MGDGLPRSTSKEAAEGTAYHGLSETALRGGPLPSARIGERVQADGFTFTINDEDAAFAEEYIAAIRARAAAGGVVHVEVRTDTSALLGIPAQGGTIDARIFFLINGALEVHDLKFGRGVKVYAVKRGDAPLWRRVSDQLGIYGASEFNNWRDLFGFTSLKLAIHQPRIHHYDEVTLTAEEVELFAAAVREDAQRSLTVWQSWNETDDMRLPLNPSLGACRWCPRGGSCQVRALSILETYHSMPIKNLPLLTAEQLGAALDKCEEIENWTRAVRGEALQRVEQKAADAPKGWKLVEGRKGDRTADPEAITIRARNATAAFKDQPGEPYAVELPKELYTEPELKSVAQLEKACKKLGALGKAIWGAIVGDENTPSLITQSPGRPSLVRDFDARPELAVQPVSFELHPVDKEFNRAATGAEGLI